MRIALALALVIGFAACRRTSSSPAASDGKSTVEAAALDPSATLLGGERGLDHVGVAVTDLAAATRTFHDRLGFSRPIEGTLPNGIKNVNYYFADGTYLETLVHWDREKAAWLAAFTDKHSGALFAVLSARSHEATSAFLARRGIPVGAPYSGTIQTAGDAAMPGERWQTFFLPEGTLPGDPLYFIAYPRASREDFLRKLQSKNIRRQLYHDNTAISLRAVWIAVPELDAATRAYEAIGLARGRTFDEPQLEAKGQVFAAGAGEIWLLAPKNAAGPVARFLVERGGPGVLGVTLLAGSVPAAARLRGERTGRALPTYEGLLGTSVRVPPELAHGVYIEFAQHLVAPPPN